MSSSLKSDEVQTDWVPLLGHFVDERFSHGVRVTHMDTGTVVYRAPFDFSHLPEREELLKIALSELQEKVEKKRRRSTF